MNFDEYDPQNWEPGKQSPENGSSGQENREYENLNSNSAGEAADSQSESGVTGQPAEQQYSPAGFQWDDVEPPRQKKPKKEKGSKEPKVPKEPVKNRGLKIFAITVSCVLVVTLAAFGFVLANSWTVGGNALTQGSSTSSSESSRNENTPDLVIGQTPDADSTAAVDGPLTVPQIASKAKPSVVGVVAYTKESGLKAASEGSGIIMTSDGYIITNAHVIDGAQGVKVVLENGDEFEASIIGADTRTDLAVIKIEKENLTPAEFGDSTKLVTGETVVAIGNPGGLKYAGSVTQAIVSATDRVVASTADSGYALSCIQTDAAINPGNSGGALVNVYGQVIGINSSKIVGTDFEGIGFSISINEAKPIIDDLIDYGYVKNRVKIGITVTPIDEVLANMYGIPEGLRIVSIGNSSDAVSKGLQVGDIITKVDGNEMAAFSDLSAILKTKKAGDTITLDVYRQTSGSAGRTFTVSLTLMEDRGIQETDQSVVDG